MLWCLHIHFTFSRSFDSICTSLRHFHRLPNTATYVYYILRSCSGLSCLRKYTHVFTGRISERTKWAWKRKYWDYICISVDYNSTTSSLIHSCVILPPPRSSYAPRIIYSLLHFKIITFKQIACRKMQMKECNTTQHALTSVRRFWG